MKLSEITPSSRNVDIEATVIQKDDPRDVNTKFGQTRVANATLEDDSGRFKLTLWGEHADQVKQGNKIRIKNGFVSTFRDDVQLSVGKFGKLEIVQ